MIDANPLLRHTAPRKAGVGFLAERSGGIALVTPLTPSARAWLEARIDDEAGWLGEASAVGMRYFPALADAIIAAGLTSEREPFAN